jgi:hypothetical protein
MNGLALLVALACVDDSGKDDPLDTGLALDSGAIADTSADTGGGASAELTAGLWVSEGEDLSALLAFLKVVRVEASFQGSGSYSVVSTDDRGDQVTYAGTYAVDRSTVPHGILMTQTAPGAATAEGIWQITDSTLRYEVLQTSPPVAGCSAPTPEGGFGSTRCSPPLYANANVQTFRLR